MMNRLLELLTSYDNRIVTSLQKMIILNVYSIIN